MKSVVVVKMKEGYLVLPYDASILSTDFAQGRAIERSGYDSSNLGKAVEAIFREAEEDPAKPSSQGKGRSG